MDTVVTASTAAQSPSPAAKLSMLKHRNAALTKQPYEVRGRPGIMDGWLLALPWGIRTQSKEAKLEDPGYQGTLPRICDNTKV